MLRETHCVVFEDGTFIPFALCVFIMLHLFLQQGLGLSNGGLLVVGGSRGRLLVIDFYFNVDNGSHVVCRAVHDRKDIDCYSLKIKIIFFV